MQNYEWQMHYWIFQMLFGIEQNKLFWLSKMLFKNHLLYASVTICVYLYILQVNMYMKYLYMLPFFPIFPGVPRSETNSFC